MLDQLPATGISDRLSDALYKWRGIGKWPEAEAIVSDYSWTPDPEVFGEGMYRVSFSYRAGGEIRTGLLSINGIENAPPYERGTAFTLRYNPKRPSRYYYENVLSKLERTVLVVATLGLGAASAYVIISLFPG